MSNIAECGDFDAQVHLPGYVSELLPFMPDQSPILERRIAEIHQALRLAKSHTKDAAKLKLVTLIFER
jgi:hypothetical protein